MAEETEFRRLLDGAGFADIAVRTVSVDFPLRTTDEMITALAEGTVRTGALLRAADESQRSRIRAALEERLDRWRSGEGYVVPAPVKIASGQKGA